MASPADGGRKLAESLGITLDPHLVVPDFSRQPNPLPPTPLERGQEPQ